MSLLSDDSAPGSPVSGGQAADSPGLPEGTAPGCGPRRMLQRPLFGRREPRRHPCMHRCLRQLAPMARELLMTTS